MLHVARYPYIALLSGSGSRTKKVASSEGFALPADLLQVLQPAVEQHGAQFIADQADHNERVCHGTACISKQSRRQAGTAKHLSHSGMHQQQCLGRIALCQQSTM